MNIAKKLAKAGFRWTTGMRDEAGWRCTTDEEGGIVFVAVTREAKPVLTSELGLPLLSDGITRFALLEQIRQMEGFTEFHLNKDGNTLIFGSPDKCGDRPCWHSQVPAVAIVEAYVALSKLNEDFKRNQP